MIKLATPISNLFEDNSAGKKIIARSFCLECREESLKNKEPKQYLFHFDRDIIRPWNGKDKDFFQSVVLLKKELKLATFHMSAACSKPFLKEGVFYCGGKDFSRQEMLDNARNNIGWIRACIGDKHIEIAVENNNFYPTPAYQYITDPDFISRVVIENRISFLFDIAHAKITASNKDVLYEKYMTALPLDRVVQIHVSKEGLNDKGWACDSHELPDESTFGEIKELVRKFSPEYLTIEYYKDRDKLIQVLEQYRQLCGEPKESIV